MLIYIYLKVSQNYIFCQNDIMLTINISYNTKYNIPYAPNNIYLIADFIAFLEEHNYCWRVCYGGSKRQLSWVYCRCIVDPECSSGLSLSLPTYDPILA